ncbi:MAG: LysM peptidoglycan-binding domain-containing protein [SAR324 cluster bacterium]|uniref:LysM peptidoglycan-binding domain-containing protein n=1 Tax=SAR324 cluster bacterium TaxID=2024889 RepID=A0A7X9IJJ6_9DELT|nr:LysM peptidoglycan-binding domain-containing protein [SAR324 cluster bacterium]
MFCRTPQIIGFVICILLFALPGFSDSQQNINSQFRVPALLRDRVDFWIDVFTKYGEHQKIVHHRLYPQVVFGILDFTKEAKELDSIELARLKKAQEENAIESIKEALRGLADGKKPSNLVEKYVFKSMSAIRGGREKYLDVLNKDLVRTQTGIKEKTIEALKRSGRYMHFIEDIFVNEFGLPKEITRLPLIESTFNYEAYSSAGAAGLWQFMPQTAKSFGMRVNKFVDERRDPIIASRAAAEYIKRAYNRLGNWPLAITSYNHGVTGVLRKMNQEGTRDLARVIESGERNPFGFASSNFWPEFLAAVEIYANRQQYFPGLELDPPLYLSERRLETSIPIQDIIRQTGVSSEKLRLANYALSELVWQGRAPVPVGYILRVPENYASQLSRAALKATAEAKVNTRSIPSSLVYGGANHTVRKGDTLLSIAKKYDTTVSDLIALNKLKGKQIKIGQVLSVKTPQKRQDSAKWTSMDEPSSVVTKKSTSEFTPKPPKTKFYRVEKRDTLSSIAKKFNVNIDAIKKANGMSSSNVKAGQMLKIP